MATVRSRAKTEQLAAVEMDEGYFLKAIVVLKAIEGLKEAKHKFDDLYRQVMGRKPSAVVEDLSLAEKV